MPSSINGHLRCSYLYVIVNSAMNMEAQYFFEIWSSRLLDTYPEVEMLSHILVVFLILRNFHSVFQSGLKILHSHSERIVVFPHHHQHLLSSF